MKMDSDINLPRVAGIGPTAWDGDTQKVCMHPPIPGHIEFVAEEMDAHAEHHHMVHRRHPEKDNEVLLIRKEITPEDMGYHDHHLHHLMHKHQRENEHGATATNEEYKAHAGKHHLLHQRHPDREHDGAHPT